MPTTVEIGSTLGRYVLSQRVGQGGMAEVYRGTLVGIGGFQREVAIKILRTQVSGDEQFVEMLLDEARIAGSVTHSNVVQMLDVGRDGDDVFYVVMEFVDGGDLRGLLRAAPGGKLPLEHALYVAMEVAQGLAAVHSSAQRIIHRDVSPTNVLLSLAGEVKLSDFGIARAVNRLARTRAGSVKGKMRYMAPEQVAGEPVDARADLYALGVVLCETLVGPPLWEGPDDTLSPGKLLARASRVVPADVLEVLSRALAANPDRRFDSAAAMRRALAEPLHRRQPGYGEAQLAAFLADPAALPSIVVSERHDTPQPPPERPEPPTRNLRARLLRFLERVQALSPRALALVGTTALVVITAALLLMVGSRKNVSAAAVLSPPRPAVAAAVKTEPLGRLAVYAKPGVMVRVAGQARRSPALFDLPAGRHRVEIGRKAVRWVDVKPDRTSELTMR